MKTRHGVRVALLLTLGAAACASGEGTQSTETAPGRTAVVQVANNGFSDVTVYVVQSGMRRRLGTVTGLSQQRFLLPRPAVRVRAGDAVDLRLHSTLSMSSVSVWVP
jgi:hypothetical protein